METPGKRYFLNIAFRGAVYHGWQRQKNHVTVQQVMEDRLSTLLQEKMKVIGCGRTDSRVHAKNYYLHFDTSHDLENRFLRKLNSLLPGDIWAKEIFAAKHKELSARFDAISRTYEYWICTIKDPFYIDLATYFYQPMDLELMNRACGYLMKFEHFESFSKLNKDLNNYRCEVYEASWDRRTGELLCFRITANRFVRSMVRLIVGTMADLGTGKISLEEFRKTLEKRDRKLSGKAAPPDGLYLTDVEYPGDALIRLD